MRIALGIGGFLALACALILSGAFMWVGQALAGVREPPIIGCLASRDREKLASGGFSLHERDVFVTQMANYRQGVPRSLEWHLRRGLIQLTYVTFWSERQRDRLFDDLVDEMEPCAPPGRFRRQDRQVENRRPVPAGEQVFRADWDGPAVGPADAGRFPGEAGPAARSALLDPGLRRGTGVDRL